MGAPDEVIVESERVLSGGLFHWAARESLTLREYEDVRGYIRHIRERMRMRGRRLRWFSPRQIQRYGWWWVDEQSIPDWGGLDSAEEACKLAEDALAMESA